MPFLLLLPVPLYFLFPITTTFVNIAQNANRKFKKLALTKCKIKNLGP